MAITIKKIKNIKLLRVLDSTRFRMVGIYFILVLCALLLMGLYVVGFVSGNLYETKRSEMFTKANMIGDNAAGVWQQITSGDQWAAQESVSGILAGTSLRGMITDTAMTVVYDTTADTGMTGKVLLRSTVKLALDNQQSQELEKLSSGEKLQSVAVPVKRNGRIVGSVYLTGSVGDIENMIRSIGANMLLISILICLLIGILSFGMSYLITSPMREFICVAQEISKGDFNKRIKVKGHSEIAQMGEALNYMCAELGHLEERRRKFVSDASHELKTPMATIKLICDSIVATDHPDVDMVKEFLNDLSEEVDRLTRIVERLLILTKLDSGETTLKLEPADICMLLERIVRKLAPAAAAKNITLSSNLSADIQPVFIDYDKIWEAVYNIIDNAIKYSKIGSIVTVSAAVKENKVIVSVADNGPGIPDEYKERIFERFYRLDDSRARDTGGTGLGLSITKEAVSMHGGSIYVTDHENGGSVFVIELPVDKNALPE